MKRLFSFALFLIYFSLIAQTKQQLMNTIIRVNELHGDCSFGDCEDNQFMNFQKLKKMLTNEELLELTNHKNSALRMYAVQELIWTGKGDPVKYLQKEFKNKATVVEQSGCIKGDDYTSNVVYHIYWNHIGGGSVGDRSYGHKEDPDPARDSIFRADVTMMKMDSLVIFQNRGYWLLYYRAFNNRKFPKEYLPRIEELAFKQNNSYALQQLMDFYYEQYKNRIIDYWKYEFPKAKFKDDNSIMYFREIVGMMLDSKNEELLPIIADKLRIVKDWEHGDGFFVDRITSLGLHPKNN